jgi:hypothetical protein
LQAIVRRPSHIKDLLARIAVFADPAFYDLNAVKRTGLWIGHRLH